jgi:hypothetical protein
MTTPSDGFGAHSVFQWRVHGGQFRDESWVYAWFSEADQGVVYVGATQLPPQVRTWLHLHDPDPDIGRLAARLPGAPNEDLAFSPSECRSRRVGRG